MKYQAGDKIKVETNDSVFEGSMLPRPELLDQDIIVVKLNTGYNIGINKNEIKSVTVLEKFKEENKENKKTSKLNPKLPTVSILSCGGTISSRIDYRTGGVYADYTAEDFIEMEPKLAKFANIKAKNIMTIMSEDMQAKDWKKMAQSVKDELKDSDAVILTQGTDTLHFSTAALSFFLQDLNKPVIFTAAQRSIDRGSSDAFVNLLCAVKAGVEFDGAGVFLVMHGSSSDDYCLIHKGTKVRKMHSLRRDSFRSINEIPLAKIFPDKKIEILNSNYTKQSDVKNKLKVIDSFEDKTALILIHPGMDPGVLDYYMDKGYKGIVLAATALGHVPTFSDKSLLPQLERAKKEGVAIVVATQCLYGRVDPLVYSPLRKLSVEKEVIFAEDMLPETAYVKLGWVLSQTTDKIKVKEMMTTNISGEINFRRHPEDFLN